MLARRVRLDERVPGHGIGLAVVKDLVASHQGELKVSKARDEPSRDQRGSSFFVETVRRDTARIDRALAVARENAVWAEAQ